MTAHRQYPLRTGPMAQPTESPLPRALVGLGKSLGLTEDKVRRWYEGDGEDFAPWLARRLERWNEDGR